jgi:hypothetical protein
MAESLETLLGAMGKINIGYITREREQEIKAPISDALVGMAPCGPRAPPSVRQAR